MKIYQLFPLTFVCMLLITASCKMKPAVPEAMKLPLNGNSAGTYANAENKYKEQWFESISSLRKTIQTELAGREYKLPPAETTGNDTAIAAGENWNIVVKDGKEVDAVSGENTKRDDRIIFTENDPAFHVRLHTSASGSFIFIESSSPLSSEVWMLPFSCKSLKPSLVAERKPGVTYKVDHFGGNNLWILSNENAPKRCLLIAPSQNPGSGSWKAAVRENDSIFIDDFSLLNLQYLVLIQRMNLKTSLEITSIYPEKVREASVENVINFPEPEGRISDLSYNKDDDKIIFRYSSILTPPTCYTYGIHSMHMGIRWKKQIKNYRPEDYKAEVSWVAGKNNSRIPVSLIRKRELDMQDGTNPLLLFIDSGPPGEKENGFSPELLSLTDRGFYIAFIHLSSAGSDEKECNDKVAAALSALIGKKYTSAGLITLAGKDNGALIAFNTAKEHPSWVRVLILENPAFSCNTANTTATDIYLNAYTNGPDKGFAGLSLASGLRKITKPGNTLLVSTGTDRPANPGLNTEQITFILSSFGIHK